MQVNISRKKFLQISGIATAGVLFSPSLYALNAKPSPIKAIAFDGFPIFDPRPIFKAVHELFPEKGKEIVDLWKAKQFGYQWLRVAAGQYKNFWDVTVDALDYAVAANGEQISEEGKKKIMGKYKQINIWPDVIPALKELKEQGLRLCFLSNMTEAMLRQGIENSGTQEFFDAVISTDQQKTYKPSPTAYQMGIDMLNLKKEEILFVAFAGWDMAGAKWFGYPTFWMNRLNAPIDNLDASPDGMGNSLTDLPSFVAKYSGR